MNEKSKEKESRINYCSSEEEGGIEQVEEEEEEEEEIGILSFRKVIILLNCSQSDHDGSMADLFDNSSNHSGNSNF